MAETPPPAPPAPPAPPSDDDQKKKLHGWLDEWADARAAKNPPKRTQTGERGTDIFSSLFGA